MLSAISFNLDQSEILSSGNELTLYQTAPNLTLDKDAFEEHHGKRRKYCLPTCSLFPTRFLKDLFPRVEEIKNCDYVGCSVL